MSDHACAVCGQSCHCMRLYTDHHCCVTEGPLEVNADSSGTCCVCGVSATEARVQGGLCVSRGMCESRRRKRAADSGLLQDRAEGTKPLRRQAKRLARLRAEFKERENGNGICSGGTAG